MIESLIELWKLLLSSNSILLVGTIIAIVLVYIAFRMSPFIHSEVSVKAEKLEGAVIDSQMEMVDDLHTSYSRQLDTLMARVAAQELLTATRETASNERAAKLDERLVSMNETIHNQQIKLTRLQVLVMQMNGLLASGGIVIPDYMKAEMDQLLEGDK